MKKIFLSFFVTAAFVIYIIATQGPDEGRVIAPPISLARTTQASSGSGNASAGNQGNAQNKKPAGNPASSPPSSSPKKSGLYADGAYSGSVADAYYGNVQVRAVVQNGKISDVQFLQYPSDRRTSIEINTQAMPYLKAEAIQAQSANVDVVSGATDTSQAFMESLAAALAQARN